MEERNMDAGRVGILMAGSWNTSQSYEMLSCVSHNGKSWGAKKDVPAGVEPSEANSAFWQLMSDRGAQGIQGPVGPQGNSAFDGTGVEIVNNLTQGGQSAVLSAEQGKVLKTELTELESELGSEVKALSNTKEATTSSLYYDIIELKIKKGENITVSLTSDTAVISENLSLLGDDNNFLIGYIKLGETKTFTLTDNIDYVKVRANGANSFTIGGNVVLAVEHGLLQRVSDVEKRVSDVKTNIDKLSSDVKETNESVGYNVTSTKEVTTSAIYYDIINVSAKKGDSVEVSLISDTATTSQNLTLFGTDSDLLIGYITLGQTKTFVLANDIDYVKIRANSISTFTSGGNVTLSVKSGIQFKVEKLVKDVDAQKTSTNERFTEVNKRLGILSSTKEASTSATFADIINVSAKKGETLRISLLSDKATTSQNLSLLGNDNNLLIGYITIGQVKEFTLSNDIDYVKVRANGANSFTTGGDIIFSVVCGIEQELSSIKDSIGFTATKVINAVSGKTFTESIQGFWPAGQKLIISVKDDGVIKNGGTAAIFGDTFTTKYLIEQPREVEVTLEQATTSIGVSVNYNNVVADGAVTLAITPRTLLNIPYNRKHTPVISIIDDDTMGIRYSKMFHDACVANDIKGTFATLTSYYPTNEGLAELLREYERDGFQITMHGYSQIDIYRPNEYRDIVAAEDNLVHGIQDAIKEGFIRCNELWVTPYGVKDTDIQNLAKKWGFKGLVSIAQSTYVGADESTYNRYAIPRVGFNATDEGSTTSFAQLKSIMDDAAKNGGWLLIGTHMFDGWTEELISTRFAEMVTYAKNLGFTFRTLADEFSRREYIFRYYESLSTL